MPGLDDELADDRILACALAAGKRRRDYLATTEFALHAKALSCGIESRYLATLVAAREEVSMRDRAQFKNSWRRVETSETPWLLVTRILSWLDGRVAARETSTARETGEPAYVADLVRRFDDLRTRWIQGVSLYAVLGPALGLTVAVPSVNMGVHNITEPPRPFGPVVEGAYESIYGRQRPETPGERERRIEGEQQATQRAEANLVEAVLQRAEFIHDWIVERVGDFLL